MYDFTRWRSQAAGRVNADGTITSPGGVFGCQITKNAGLGSYRVTVFVIPPPVPPPIGSVAEGQGQPIPSERLLALITPIGPTPRFWTLMDISDDIKDIEISNDLGVLVDNAFVFNIGYLLPA